MSTCSRREYSCRAYSRREYAGRDIAVTAITGDADDGRVLEFAAQLQRRPQGAPRRRAAKQAFLAAGQPHRVFGVLCRGLDHALDARRIIDARQISLRTFSYRSDERRVGNARTRPGRSRWWYEY